MQNLFEAHVLYNINPAVFFYYLLIQPYYLLFSDIENICLMLMWLFLQRANKLVMVVHSLSAAENILTMFCSY